MSATHSFDDILDKSIQDLDLPARAINGISCLTTGMWHSITIRHLAGMSAIELMRLPKFGKRSLEDVRDRLAARGVYLRGEGPPAKPRLVECPKLSVSHRLQIIEAKLDMILSRLLPP
jgi:DNA-directed RNA polymerase alpha subunit